MGMSRAGSWVVPSQRGPRDRQPSGVNSTSVLTVLSLLSLSSQVLGFIHLQRPALELSPFESDFKSSRFTFRDRKSSTAGMKRRRTASEQSSGIAKVRKPEQSSPFLGASPIFSGGSSTSDISTSEPRISAEKASNLVDLTVENATPSNSFNYSVVISKDADAGAKGAPNDPPCCAPVTAPIEPGLSTRNNLGLPDIFDKFIAWMYYGSYSDPWWSRGSVLSTRDNIDAWIMGDKLLAVPFKNYAMGKLYGTWTADSPIRLDTATLQVVLDGTMPGSKLRLFFLDAFTTLYSNPDRLDGDTEDWDEILLNHDDARKLLLESYSARRTVKTFIKAKDIYMEK
ncbi:uncharacterized protein EI97DRAFT_504700 [Westerdykella ornata]|uniref:Uncharacterized protein n=1 Tax=Westerdykella ornata TaxID=318751 RepID=A0A6A6J731_WESOR|nr:uncharacterized protein EI97DRAFT_504700 [Westerdykella ornata]KAF2271808.1 hypothetical protein EI97DRAFT_504700 [Westerdykella ornata]